ncbi:MAG TPA: thiol reductant ABC exporter subunit CydD [Actinomycetota bacterium]|nr:thiol reductant ABC exporter subunit CydD [Actinomycetota bacterium]
MPTTSRRGLRPFDRRLLGRVAVARWALAADVAAGLTGTLLLLAQVTLLAAVIAGAAEGGLRQVPATQVAALVAIILARAGLAQVVEVSGRRAATKVMSALRAALVERCLRPGGAQLRHTGSAELATSAVQGVDGLETYFARYLPQVVLAVTVPVAVLLWSAVIDLQSAVIMLVTLPVIPVFMVLIGKSAGARSRANWQALVVLSAHFLDVVRGLPTLRAFNRGSAQISSIQETTDRYRRTTMGTLRVSFLSGVVLDLATTLSTALVAVTLGVRLVAGGLGLRPALTVLLLVPELYAPIRMVGTLFHASADGLAAVERILDALDRTPAGAVGPVTVGMTGNGHGAVPDPATEPIRLRSVTVRYPGRAASALDGLDLDIHPAELVAVVGATGAGKTTLGRVLLGLTRPDEGVVLAGGRPLADVDPEAWRNRVAWAPQHPTLIPGTVTENIALGRPDADAAAIEDAARRAAAHPFIQRLPEGYDTVVGAGGRGLSAGQRQRLGLARALLRDASLLVLDEPTVHLDPVAARRVADTVEELRASRTIVLVTHDRDLAARADRAVRLDAGRRVDPCCGD